MIERNCRLMKNWVATSLSIVAIVVSMVAMAKVAPVEGLNFDYYGAIIGVLSFLVTLLMGYQIYTVINVKKELDDVRKLKEEIDAKLQEKADVLSKEYKDELANTAPLIMAIASKERDVVESEVFKAYRVSKNGQLAKELAGRTLLVMLWEMAKLESDERKHAIEELSKNIERDDAVEYYTDYAKKEKSDRNNAVEQFLLELIGTLSDKE